MTRFGPSHVHWISGARVLTLADVARFSKRAAAAPRTVPETTKEAR